MAARRPANAATPDYRELAYGEFPDTLLFIPRPGAVYLAACWDALQSATTWGEFRSRLPAGAWDELVRQYEAELSEQQTGDKDRFEADHVPGHLDGYFPGWADESVVHWMPKEIQAKRYCKLVTTVLDGPIIKIDPQRESEIVADLQAAGYRCTRDQGLVERACGLQGRRK